MCLPAFDTTKPLETHKPILGEILHENNWDWVKFYWYLKKKYTAEYKIMCMAVIFDIPYILATYAKELLQKLKFKYLICGN